MVKVRSHKRKINGKTVNVSPHSRSNGSKGSSMRYNPKKKTNSIEQFDKSVLTEREVNLIKRRLNDGMINISDLNEIDALYDKSGIRLTAEQNQKAKKYLMNLWKTPKGKERLNSPFGGREESVLETFREVRLIDFYNASHGNGRFYVPYYEVFGDSGTFEYAVYNGSIHIMG